jgi:hypothetical protein
MGLNAITADYGHELLGRMSMHSSGAQGENDSRVIKGNQFNAM